MRLSIRNLGKIKEADVTIDGITVIAAPNDTGKSTIGKAAYALTKTFEDFNGRVHDELADAVRERIERDLPEGIASSGIGTSGLERALRAIYDSGSMTWHFAPRPESILATALSASANRISDDGQLCSLIKTISARAVARSHDDVEKAKVPEEFLDADDVHAVADWLISDVPDARETRKKLLALLTIDMREKAKELADRTFSGVFNGQIRNLYGEPDSDTVVALHEEQEGDWEPQRTVTFSSEGECAAAEPVSDERRHVYIIDDPNVIEKFDDNYFPNSAKYRGDLIEACQTALRARKNNTDAGLSESILAKADMRNVIDLLKRSFAGRYDRNQNGNGVLVKEGLREPVPIGNASMGSKAMLLLRFLVENIIVRKGDILVLDEPEIHLHPEWQITYAHALVLIAKQLGINMIVTTHSPYFLKALAGYSGIEDYGEHVHYYTADDNADGSNSFREVQSEDVGTLYSTMARPLRTIDEDVFRKMQGR